MRHYSTHRGSHMTCTRGVLTSSLCGCVSSLSSTHRLVSDRPAVDNSERMPLSVAVWYVSLVLYASFCIIV
jgi:lipid-A-disaccharide synthase-like uncharacterized protein